MKVGDREWDYICRVGEEKWGDKHGWDGGTWDVVLFCCAWHRHGRNEVGMHRMGRMANVICIGRMPTVAEWCGIDWDGGVPARASTTNDMVESLWGRRSRVSGHLSAILRE